MGQKPARRTSMIMAAFAALLLMLVAAPHEAHAQNSPLQNPAWANCRNDKYQAHMKWAQTNTIALNKIWSNATPPTMNKTCLNTLMTLFSTLGTITDPFNIIWHLVVALIQNFVNQICQQIMAAINGAINMIKAALCIPIPSFNLNFNLGGFGGGACSGVGLIGNANTAGVGQTMPPLWYMFNGLTPR